MGQALMENRHGLLLDFHVTTATGTAERDVVPQLIDEARLRGFHPRTLGADKAYDTREFVQCMRAQGVTPHVAQNTSGRRSAVDGRTTHEPGYDASQKCANASKKSSAGSKRWAACAENVCAAWSASTSRAIWSRPLTTSCDWLG